MKIDKIFEEEYIFDYLEKRGLISQYKKSKQNILNGQYSGNKIGFREPKKDGILYFRINKQYRAFCRLNSENVLIVFDIDNHQK